MHIISKQQFSKINKKLLHMFNWITCMLPEEHQGFDFFSGNWLTMWHNISAINRNLFLNFHRNIWELFSIFSFLNNKPYFIFTMYRKRRPTNILANALHILYYAMEDDCTCIRYAPEQSKLIYEIHVQYMKYILTFFKNEYVLRCHFISKYKHSKIIRFKIR